MRYSGIKIKILIKIKIQVQMKMKRDGVPCKHIAAPPHRDVVRVHGDGTHLKRRQQGTCTGPPLDGIKTQVPH